MARPIPLLTLVALLPCVIACRATPPPVRALSISDPSTPAQVPTTTAPGADEAVPAPTYMELRQSDGTEASQGTTAETLPLFDNVNRKAGLRVGGVAYGSFDTSAQVAGSSGAGAVLDFEDLLGLDESNSVLRLDGFYNFNSKHRVDLSYYDITRTGTRTLTDPVEIGDVVIPAGDTVSNFDTMIFKLAYRYNFVAEHRTVIGGSFGFHIMRVNLGLRSQTFAIEESLGATAPLPVLGLHGEHALSPNWSLFAAGEIFQLELGDYGGTIGDFRLGLNWDVFDHIGVGIELNSFGMDATIKDDNLKAEVEYSYQGAGIYLRGYL